MAQGGPGQLVGETRRAGRMPASVGYVPNGSRLVAERAAAFDAPSGIGPFWEDQRMSGEVPIEIEDKPTAVSIMFAASASSPASRGGVTAITEWDGSRKTPTKSCRFHRRKIITSHL